MEILYRIRPNIRDTDSLINHREAAAVTQWIESGKKFHIMRDDLAHTRLILSGMWGGTSMSIPNIKSLIKEYGKLTEYGDDDNFCSQILYPIFKKDMICHDDYSFFNDANPFPPHPPMIGTCYIGERITTTVKNRDIQRCYKTTSDQLHQTQQALKEAQTEIARLNHIIHKTSKTM